MVTKPRRRARVQEGHHLGQLLDVEVGRARARVQQVQAEVHGVRAGLDGGLHLRPPARGRQDLGLHDLPGAVRGARGRRRGNGRSGAAGGGVCRTVVQRRVLALFGRLIRGRRAERGDARSSRAVSRARRHRGAGIRAKAVESMWECRWKVSGALFIPVGKLFDDKCRNRKNQPSDFSSPTTSPLFRAGGDFGQKPSETPKEVSSSTSDRLLPRLAHRDARQTRAFGVTRVRPWETRVRPRWSTPRTPRYAAHAARWSQRACRMVVPPPRHPATLPCRPIRAPFTRVSLHPDP